MRTHSDFGAVRGILSGALLLGLAGGVPAEDESLTGVHWGCACLLCLANPEGPVAEAACRPPIEKLWRHLRKGGSVPACDTGDAESRIERVDDPYDPCGLLGLRDAAKGWVVRGAFGTNARGGRVLRASGSPRWNDAGARVESGDGSDWGTKACAGGEALGSVDFEVSCDSEGCTYARAVVYETLLWQSPQSASAIDVYVGGALWKRVRY